MHSGEAQLHETMQNYPSREGVGVFTHRPESIPAF